jgi:hypothetical protein
LQRRVGGISEDISQFNFSQQNFKIFHVSNTEDELGVLCGGAIFQVMSLRMFGSFLIGVAGIFLG